MVRWGRSKIYLICIFLMQISTLTDAASNHRQHAKKRGTSEAAAEKQPYNTSYACEGQVLNITCPTGYWINVIRANYGRFSVNICNEKELLFVDTHCLFTKSTEIMKERCSNRSVCIVPPVVEVFGDACPLTEKYLEAQYNCTPELIPAKKLRPGTTESSNFASNLGVGALGTTTTVGPTGAPTPSSVFRVDEGQKWTQSALCPETIRRGVIWPASIGWQLVKRQCPQSSEKFARWTCSENGQWLGYPDLSDCKSLDLEQSLELMGRARNYNYLVNSLESFKNEVKLREDLYGGDITTVIRGLKKISDSYLQYDTEYTVQTAKNLSRLVVDGLNDLLKPSRKNSWQDLSRDQQAINAVLLIKTVESNAMVLSKVALKTETFIFPSIVLEVGVVQPKEYVKFPSLSLYDPHTDSIQLPNELLSNVLSGEGMSTVIFTSYDNMATFLKPSVDSKNIQRVVASKLLCATLPNAQIGAKKLVEPVLITFTLNQAPNLTNPTCVYWQDEKENVVGGGATVGDGGHWSTRGCQRLQANNSHVTCACNHLTVFAVLMDVRGIHLEEVHRLALTFVTFVGCAVSTVALGLSLLALWCLRGFTGDRATIHKNLCFCLLIAELTFLLGISETQKPLVCGLVAGFLHYFFLAAFAWMLLEGFQLYVLLVEVFETSDKNRKKYFYLFAYGMPLVIVSISLCVDHSSYGTSNYCWLNTENYFVFSFVGPVIVVLAANFIFLLMALVIMCKHSGAWNVGTKRHSPMRSSLKNFAAWLKAAFVLIFLLGLTWTFGLFYVSEQSKLAAYMFCVLNSTQGIFIFVFHVLLNEKMRNEYNKWVRRSDWLPFWLRSSALSSQVDHPPPLDGAGCSMDCRLGDPIDSTIGRKKNLPCLLNFFYLMTGTHADKRNSCKRLFDHSDSFNNLNENCRDKPLFSYREDYDNFFNGYDYRSVNPAYFTSGRVCSAHLNSAHLPVFHSSPPYNNLPFQRPSAPNFPPPAPPVDRPSTPSSSCRHYDDQRRSHVTFDKPRRSPATPRPMIERADGSLVPVCTLIERLDGSLVPACRLIGHSDDCSPSAARCTVVGSSLVHTCQPLVKNCASVECGSLEQKLDTLASVCVPPACVCASRPATAAPPLVAQSSASQISPVRSEPDSGYCDGGDSLLNKPKVPGQLPSGGDCGTSGGTCKLLPDKPSHNRTCNTTVRQPSTERHYPTAASECCYRRRPRTPPRVVRSTVNSAPCLLYRVINSDCQDCANLDRPVYCKESKTTQTGELDRLLPADSTSNLKHQNAVCAYEIPVGQKMDESENDEHSLEPLV